MVPQSEVAPSCGQWGFPANRGTASRTAIASAGRENAGAMGSRVLIVDDHAGFRAHARRLLECEGYRVVGEAADCAEALEAARELAPDFALVDVCLPGEDGFALTNRLQALGGAPAVVLTSSRAEADLEEWVEESPACGFVPKSALSRKTIEEVLP
jgi:two-component system nitrate/nitrite response regulator NarL